MLRLVEWLWPVRRVGAISSTVLQSNGALGSNLKPQEQTATVPSPSCCLAVPQKANVEQGACCWPVNQPLGGMKACYMPPLEGKSIQPSHCIVALTYRAAKRRTLTVALYSSNVNLACDAVKAKAFEEGQRLVNTGHGLPPFTHRTDGIPKCGTAGYRTRQPKGEATNSVYRNSRHPGNSR